jgi:GDP-mannose 4,6-dehydratase
VAKENRDIYVTGADGFLGSHLVDSLKEEKRVRAVVRQQEGLQTRNIESQGRTDIVRGDITDSSCVRKFLEPEREKPKTVVHLAAQSDVQKSWDSPFTTLKTNTIGTAKILEQAKIASADTKIIFAGTSEQYGNQQQKTLTERSQLNPESIYGSSKTCSDFLCENYCKKHDGVNGFTMRMFNLFGPRQRPSCLTPTIIQQAIQQKRIALGNLTPKRDFLYVQDAVRAIKTLLEEPANRFDRYVFGTGRPYSVKEWCEKILNVGVENGYWEEKASIKQKESRKRDSSNEIDCLTADSTKAQDELGWSAGTNTGQRIADTIGYYKNQTEK